MCKSFVFLSKSVKVLSKFVKVLSNSVAVLFFFENFCRGVVFLSTFYRSQQIFSEFLITYLGGLDGKIMNKNITPGQSTYQTKLGFVGFFLLSFAFSINFFCFDKFFVVVLLSHDARVTCTTCVTRFTLRVIV